MGDVEATSVGTINNVRKKTRAFSAAQGLNLIKPLIECWDAWILTFGRVVRLPTNTIPRGRFGREAGYEIADPTDP